MKNTAIVIRKKKKTAEERGQRGYRNTANRATGKAWKRRKSRGSWLIRGCRRGIYVQGTREGRCLEANSGGLAGKELVPLFRHLQIAVFPYLWVSCVSGTRRVPTAKV